MPCILYWLNAFFMLSFKDNLTFFRKRNFIINTKNDESQFLFNGSLQKKAGGVQRQLLLIYPGLWTWATIFQIHIWVMLTFRQGILCGV